MSVWSLCRLVLRQHLPCFASLVVVVPVLITYRLLVFSPLFGGAGRAIGDDALLDRVYID